jgi:hypothetical protein
MLCGLALGIGLSATAADSCDELMAQARRDCVKAASAYPPLDQPSGRVQPCEAIAFDYGLGQPVDDNRARLCAFAELDYGVLACSTPMAVA